MHTCLLSLSLLNFFIRKLTIAASFAFSLKLLLKNTGALFSIAIIKFTGLITYFLSGFGILNMALFRSIVTSKFLMKSLPKLNWSDSSRFSTTRKLIHRLPRFRAIIGVLPSTRSAAPFVCSSQPYSRVYQVIFVAPISRPFAPNFVWYNAQDRSHVK